MKIFRNISVVATVFLVSLGAAATVSVNDFGLKPDDQTDATPAVRKALDQCRVTKADKLVLAPGRYDFWPDRAVERYMFVSNDDESLKRIAFDLAGIENLELDGQGAQLVFHRYIVPVALDHSAHITLKNFSIDWARTFHSEGKILAVGTAGIDLEFPAAFPYKIESGLLTFTGENKDDAYPIGGLLEYDPGKRETAYMAGDYWNDGHLHVTEIGPHQVRLAMKIQATPGNVMTFGHNQRLCPGIVISESQGVTLHAVTIHHSNGMGVLAQRSGDLELDQVKVTPGAGRVVSLTADATHFANCRGKLVMRDCLFEGQLDDATNIHGIYVQVTRKLSATVLEVKLVHPQQFGFDVVQAGDRVEFVHADTMNTYAGAVVKAVRRLNKEYTELEFAAPVSAELKEKDVLASLEGYPDVTIRHCTIRGNRARGFLLGSRGKMLLEENTFHTAGAALLLEGDARFWFEQAGVRDLVIRRNRFENCNYGPWGKAVIEVGAGIVPEVRKDSRYNRNIRIEENVFAGFDGRLIRGYSLDGVTIAHNRIERTSTYPQANLEAPPFAFTDSEHIVIDRNEFVPPAKDPSK